MTALPPTIRQATRILTQSPGIALMAVATLALGLAAPTTMFSISSGILRNLPFDAPEELVAIEKHQPDEHRWDIGIVPEDLRLWQERQTAFEALAGVDREVYQVTGTSGAPARYEGAAMTPSGFALIGVQAALGRTLVAADALPNAAPVVVLGDRVWEERYARDPGVLGDVLMVNDVAHTVVGVMPGGFEFPTREVMWTPLATFPGAEPRAFNAFGRLSEGVGVDAARAELDTIVAGLAAVRPADYEGIAITVEPYADAARGDDAGMFMLSIMTLMLSVVLVIACVNVSSLLLTRAIDRNRELAMRMALGASRRRVIAEVLAESLVVAVLGGLAGVLLTYGAVAWFNVRLGSQVNLFWIVIRVDGAVMLFAGLLVGVATVLAGVLPALRASGVDMSAAMKESSSSATSRRSGRLFRILVGSEIALASLLLIVTGLMVKGVLHETVREYPFGPDNVLVARLDLQDFDYPDAAARLRFFEQLEGSLAGLPGVTDVVVASKLPARGSPVRSFEFAAAGGELQTAHTRWRTVGPSFFPAFRVESASGRLLLPSDTATAPAVAVVTRDFVDRYFPDGVVVGRRIRLDDGSDEAASTEIVGVVRDGGVFGEGVPGLYVPIAQAAPSSVNIAMRTEASPFSTLPALRAVVAAMDSNLPLYEVTTLRQELIDEGVEERTMGTLFGAFGVVALTMAIVGLYGVVSSGVKKRRKEFGIRRALGADTANVVRVVLRGAIVPLAVGIAVGIGLALLLAPAMGEALLGVSPSDPTIYTGVAALLIVASLVAALAPSWRATRIEPAIALRDE